MVGRKGEGREFRKEGHEGEDRDKCKEVTTSMIAQKVKEGFESDAKVFSPVTRHSSGKTKAAVP